ncbi:MAG TPA: ABC transporter substrate-binding protein, partial [Dehalococcoidia bacterium]
MAQFKAANIYHFGSHLRARPINQEDVLPVKREQPLISVYQDELGAPADFSRLLVFGWLPEGRTPFIDQRVRQAVSMAVDRDLYLNVIFNTPAFAAEGLPVMTRWNTVLSGAREGWWLDPAGTEFGPNSKYLRHDIAEGKKLLAAAGYPNGFSVKSNYVTSAEFPVARQAEMMDGFIRELGIRTTVNPLGYSDEYIPKYRDGNGQYEGWAYVAGSTNDDPVASMSNQYWSRGGIPSFQGFSAGGRNDQSGDPKVDTWIEQARVELDVDRRKSILKDLQRYLAGQMYSIPAPGVGTAFTVAWPCVGNFRVFSGARLNYG